MMRRALGSWRRMAALLAVVLAIGVALTLLPRGDALPSGPAAPCPHGFVEQLGRRGDLERRLRGTEEGRALLEALAAVEVRYCFGEVDVSVLSDAQVLLLDRRMDDAELAARTGHLLHHVRRGPPFPSRVPAGADCDALVRAALEAEAPAYALELSLRRALEVQGTRYAFEDAFRERGERAILEYLIAHPEGGPGIDALGAGYRRRCERERGSGTSGARPEGPAAMGIRDAVHRLPRRAHWCLTWILASTSLRGSSLLASNTPGGAHPW